MVGRKVNCGGHWTLTSTECWLFDDCKTCLNEKYCKGSASRDGVPTVKIVIDMLLELCGEPPEKLIVDAKEARLNDEVLDFLKKTNK